MPEVVVGSSIFWPISGYMINSISVYTVHDVTTEGVILVDAGTT